MNKTKQITTLLLNPRTLFLLLLTSLLCSGILFNTNTAIAVETPAPPFEKTAQRLRTLILEGQYATVEKFLSSASEKGLLSRGGSVYSVIVINSIFPKLKISEQQQFFPKMKAALDRWVASTPKSSYAYTVRGEFYFEYGCSVDASLWKRFGRNDLSKQLEYRAKLAGEDLRQAVKLDPSNPHAAAKMIDWLRTSGGSRTEMEHYFEIATKYTPDHLQAYLAKQNYLAPQWGGAPKEMLGFVRRAAENAPPTSSVPLIVFFAHQDMARVARQSGSSEQQYYSNPEVWSEVTQLLEKLIERFPMTEYYWTKYAEVHMAAGKLKQARRYIQRAQKIGPQSKELAKMLQKLNRLEQRKGT